MFRRRNRLTARDRKIREIVAAVPGPIGDTLLRILMMPDDERAEMIGQLHADPKSARLAELLIDLEEDRALALDLAQALKDVRP